MVRLRGLAVGRVLELTKVESHLDEHPERMGDTPFWRVLGNVQADILAETAAEGVQLDEVDTAAVRWTDAMAAQVLFRNATILMDCAEKDPLAKGVKPAKRQPVPRVERAQAITGHAPFEEQRSWRCLKCASA